jgi:putative phosphoesterase
MKVAIISDSHIPSCERRIPEPFRERIEAADHVLHAGDFDSESALADMRDLAREFTAVSGNMDPRIGLPAVASVELGGVEFVLTHGTGSPHGYEERVAETVRKHAETAAPVGVSGHTHEVLDSRHDGIRLLNPGSVTGASPATRATMMTATVADGSLTVETHEL